MPVPAQPAKEVRKRVKLLPRRRCAVRVFSMNSDYAAPADCHVIDCRGFWDPNTRHLRGHDGRHPGIQHSFLKQTFRFSRILREVKAKTVSAPGNSTVMLGFRCHKGRHRSVGIAELVDGALQVRGHRTTLEHLSIRKCTCSVCNQGVSRTNVSLAVGAMDDVSE